MTSFAKVISLSLHEGITNKVTALYITSTGVLGEIMHLHSYKISNIFNEREIITKTTGIFKDHDLWHNLTECPFLPLNYLKKGWSF